MTSTFLDGLWMWMEQQMSNKVKIAYDEMATLEVEVNEIGTILLHMTVHNNVWSKAKYKEWKEGWEVVKEKLRAKGYNEIYTLLPKNDEKIHKFNKMFGFKPVIGFSDAILFRQEI